MCALKLIRGSFAEQQRSLAALTATMQISIMPVELHGRS